MSATKIKGIADLEQIKNRYKETVSKFSHQILICSGAGCISSNCADVKNAVVDEVEKHGLLDSVVVHETGCMGICAVGPVMLILPERTFYTNLTPESAQKIFKSHVLQGKILKEFTFYDQTLNKHVPKIDDIDFFKTQVTIALRN